LELLEKDKVVRKALDGAYRNFRTYKEREWEEYLEYLGTKGLPEGTKKVTEWEMERYFHV
jgi:glutamine synthetase